MEYLRTRVYMFTEASGVLIEAFGMCIECCGEFWELKESYKWQVYNFYDCWGR